MFFVYLLRSFSNPEHIYVGITNDLERRLMEHNQGRNVHTNKFKPWKLMTSIAFDERGKAEAFERYLKSHSGRAFAKRHL
ncbi:MAG: GIY-YIG nuclease family protein [Candidatus Peribacteraceae bacterium]|nr:GIY-YIG nuclease family protein [Candidatus Peribacteraceae bacterium]MDD5740048.1 GIY-YIG nuclease family protein [Candidatus Peribacteraceae bacterium]